MSFPPVTIALIEPRIPPNTGNVGRTCVGLGLPLVLAGELGFSLDDTRLKRAGLDYWPRLDLRREPDAGAYRRRLARGRPVLFSSKAERSLFDVDLRPADTLVFGSETKGLGAEWLALDAPVVRFPQGPGIRSYNLAACVHSAAMEWVRQTGWEPPSSAGSTDGTALA